ncbi:hypothetical protein XELAEV_18003651mg [Xenopus laevis]|uniref:Uncharacterized protein n=1 Tax=Xenopus laevis TaxID=8355 RepID=A0A974BNL9_XENLA|nr:hypothetical protein XELAEV_18003651mg [Xenopus laevis]
MMRSPQHPSLVSCSQISTLHLSMYLTLETLHLFYCVGHCMVSMGLIHTGKHEPLPLSLALSFIQLLDSALCPLMHHMQCTRGTLSSHNVILDHDK